MSEQVEYKSLPVTVQGLICEARVPSHLLDDDSWEEMEISPDQIFYKDISITTWKKAAYYMSLGDEFDLGL